MAYSNLRYTGYSSNQMGYNRLFNGRTGGQGPRKYYGYGSQFVRSNNVPKKHSGCRVQKDYVDKSGKKHVLYVNAWKYTKRTGLLKIAAFVASNKYQTSKKGYVTCVATVKSQLGNTTAWAYWNPNKSQLTIPDMKLVMSGSGDYCSYLMPKKFRR